MHSNWFIPWLRECVNVTLADSDYDLVSDDIPRLRSAVSFTCAVPRTRLGDRSSAVAGPRVRNCLPAALSAVGVYERVKKLL